MVWYLTGFALLLQFYLWGLGLTFFVLPRRWRRFWPVFCPYVGVALQSGLVWTARLTNLPGTDSYAAVGLLVPGGCGWRWRCRSASWCIRSPGRRGC